MAMTGCNLHLRTGAESKRDLVWDSDADVCVLALDEFGRECVDLAREWHPELFANERTHLFRAGSGGDGWETSAALPDMEIPAFTIGLEQYLLEHGDVLRGNAQQFFNGDGGDVAAIDGERHDQCLLVGSAVNVLSMARAVVLCEEMFSDTRLLNVWRLCCFWACSEETRLPAAESKEAIHQCIQWARDGFGRLGVSFIMGKTNGFVPLAPQFVVGRAYSETTPLIPRHDSRVILAVSLIARIYQIRTRIGHGDDGSISKKILEFDYQTFATRGASSGMPTDATRPFQHLGAFIVRADPNRLCQAAACVLMERWHTLLAQQAPPEQAGLGPEVERGSTSLEEWLRTETTLVLSQVAGGMVRHGLPGEFASSSFSHQWLDGVLHWSTPLAKWMDEVTQTHAWDPLAAKPLEDWDQHLQELELRADLFFVKRRDEFLRGFRAAFVRSLHEAVMSGFGRVIIREVGDSTKGTFRPNLLSRRLLATVQQKFADESQRAEGVTAGKQTGHDHDDATLEQYPGVIHRRLLRLKRAVRCAPSPWIWLLLLPTMVLLAFHFFMITDFGYYGRFSVETVYWLKTGQAFLLSLTAGFLVYAVGLRHRAHLHHLFTQWWNLKLEYHKLRLEQQALSTKLWLFDTADRYAAWLGDPTALEGFSLEAGGGNPPSEVPPDAQIFLHHYLRTAPKAAAWYQKRAFGLLKSMRGSGRELVLPQFSTDRQESWNELKDLCGPLTGADDPNVPSGQRTFQGYLSNLMDSFANSEPGLSLPALILRRDLTPSSLSRSEPLSEWSAAFQLEFISEESGALNPDEGRLSAPLETCAIWLKTKHTAGLANPVEEWVSTQVLGTTGIPARVAGWIDTNRLPVTLNSAGTIAVAKALVPKDDEFVRTFFRERESDTLINPGFSFYAFVSATMPATSSDIIAQFTFPGTLAPASPAAHPPPSVP